MAEVISRVSIPPRQGKGVAPALVWFVAFAIFARTAYPTITWWDSSPYSLAAVTLGITTPPGSFLLTVVGWMLTRLPTGLPPAHLLNLVASALAAVTVTLVFCIARRLLRCAGNVDDTGPGGSRGTAAGEGAAGGGVVVFLGTPWQYAVQFTPYVLTSVFTSLILWAMLHWWESADRPESWRWLLFLGLLFGLDFSVHRTNALLLPGVLAWILLRHPRTLRSARAWISGASGMVVGLAFQLSIIPIAARNPPLNAGDPSTWSRFYDYVSLGQYGGGWLVQFSPRHAPLWSVQVMDFIRGFGANFLWLTGRAGMLGLLPVLFGVLGLVRLWQRNHRLAIAFAALLFLHATVTVAYFNIPEHFFRSFYRHYLPVFVTCAVLIAYGMGESLVRLRNLNWRGAWRAADLSGVLLAVVPLSQLIRNWTAVDGSHRTFTEDYATNALNGLPQNAILFTVGDNDTWPLLYMQVAGHVRSDVRIVNLSLANTAWYVDEIVRSDRSFPLPPGEASHLSVTPWTDTTLQIPVVGSSADFGLPEGLVLPDSIPVLATPTTAGKYVLPQDLVLLHILVTNGWRRPLCFSTSVGEQGPWLRRYRRLDGLFWRVVPHADPPVNRAILRKNLVETYTYRAYAQPNIPLDEQSRAIGLSYYPPFMTLAEAAYVHGERDRCREARDELLRVLPLSRLQPDSTLRRAIERLCEPPGTRSTSPSDSTPGGPRLVPDHGPRSGSNHGLPITRPYESAEPPREAHI
jgi:hypothetical protein